jgi:hypothetical protein
MSKVLAILSSVTLVCAVGVPTAFGGQSTGPAGEQPQKVQAADPFGASPATFASEDSAQFGSDEGFAGKKKSHKMHKEHRPHKMKNPGHGKHG